MRTRVLLKNAIMRTQVHTESSAYLVHTRVSTFSMQTRVHIQKYSSPTQVCNHADECVLGAYLSLNFLHAYLSTAVFPTIIIYKYSIPMTLELSQFQILTQQSIEYIYKTILLA